MKISEFFTNDYVNHASYDNLRKIASLVDGQKNASRKVLYTVLEKHIKEKIKVSQLGSKVAEFSEYLHGNLDGVIVNLGQDFPGTNNIPLIQKKGNFGTRFSPEASASRYIFGYGTEQFFELFKKEDTKILKAQYFEGQQIEPMYYVPQLPVLLINGSEGVSSGFAQKILPRNPGEIKKYILDKIKGKKTKAQITPYYSGFSGTIEQGENSSQWLIKGVASVTGINKVEVTEVPIGYDLRSYLNVLDDLEDKGIIQRYKDKSENDKFNFEVTIASKNLKEWSHDDLMSKLKLVKKVTENYTVLDENNKIVVYDSVVEVLDHYMRVKLDSLESRKEYQLTTLENEILFDNSRYAFIKGIVDETLVISKRKKSEIISDLDLNEKILKKDGSYDYLLNMNLLSLTSERLDKLASDINHKENRMKTLESKTIEEIWTDDLIEIKV